MLDCKTVSIFAYSSTREQSNKRSATKLKTRLLRHALPTSLLILRKKPTVLQSITCGCFYFKAFCFCFYVVVAGREICFNRSEALPSTHTWVYGNIISLHPQTSFCGVAKQGDIGGSQYRLQYRNYTKKNWKIPNYLVENRLNTDTPFMIGHAYLKL